LTSEKYVLSKLKTLSEKEIAEIKREFMRNIHPRFIKALSIKEPFGRKQKYVEKMKESDIGKVAHLIKVCCILA